MENEQVGKFCAILLVIGWLLWVLALGIHSWMCFAVGCGVHAQVLAFIYLAQFESR